MNQTEFNKVKAHPFHQYLGIKEIARASVTKTLLQFAST